MKAIVIGATGLVGSNLVDLLLEDEQFEQVLILHRRETGRQHDKLREVIIDFDQPENWRHLVKGDVLFSALGTTLKTAGSKEAQYKVDHTYQYEVAKAAAESEVSNYVLISASMANSSSKLFYSKMKGELEDDVKELSFDHIHLLRPGILTGERNENRTGEKIAASVMNVVGKIPGLSHLKPIHGKEVAQAMIVCLSQKREKVNIHPADELFRLAKNYGK